MSLLWGGLPCSKHNSTSDAPVRSRPYLICQASEDKQQQARQPLQYHSKILAGRLGGVLSCERHLPRQAGTS